MNESRHQFKVGLFVFGGLLVLALLLLNFSKGAALFRPSYTLEMRAPNVGGIKSRAGVLMSGVPVGVVEDARLADNGRAVDVRLRIYSQFQIPRNVRFVIEQAGFLGDQYVAIYVPTNAAPDFLKDGDRVEAPEPFNLQETARAAAGFISRIDDTAKKLNAAIERVDRMVLNEHVLGSLSNTVANLRHTSDGAVATMRGVQRIVDTNSPAIQLAVSNLLTTVSNLSQLPDRLTNTIANLDRVFLHADSLVEDSRPQVARALQNVDAATRQVTNALADVEGLLASLRSGHGIAGALFQDNHSKTNVEATLASLADLGANLKVASSNLNKHGLWWMLWKPKAEKTAANSPAPATPPARSGRGQP